MKKINKCTTIIILVVAIVVLVIDIAFTGYLKFGYNVARCGEVPIKVTKSSFFGGDIWYEVPGTYTPLGVGGVEYHCTQQQMYRSYPGIEKKL